MIIKYPDPRLNQKCEPLTTPTTKRRRKLVASMFDEMYSAGGIGLAAPQIGWLRNLFIADVGDGPLVFVNPQITWTSEKTIAMDEGCLSIPDKRVRISRPWIVCYSATDLDGKFFSDVANGLLARCVLHECDHLRGVLMLDREGK